MQAKGAEELQVRVVRPFPRRFLLFSIYVIYIRIDIYLNSSLLRDNEEFKSNEMKVFNCYHNN